MKPLHRPSVLHFDPFFGDLGGAVIVSSWMLQALRDQFDVTLLSWVAPDLDKLNRFCGTDLSAGDFRLITPNRLTYGLGQFLYGIDVAPYSAQRWAILLRMAKRLSADYDVVLGSIDEADFGEPGIQYIHYPYFGRFARISESAAGGRRLRIAPSQRFRPWRLISGFDVQRVARNLTLVNSDWTGNEFYHFYKASTQTLYPPVPGRFEPIPWSERDDAAICVGRLARDKRIDWIIEAVGLLRRAFSNFRLRIAGVRDLEFRSAMPELVEAAARHDWIELHVDLPRDELCKLMGRSKIGLHAKENEHFGIGVAEMVRSGCVVFAHNSGGPVEILDRQPRLLFDDVSEAAEKIQAVLNDDVLRERLRDQLNGVGQRLSPHCFCQRLRDLVWRFFREKRSILV